MLLVPPRKPKRSQRASQFLNYVPVITWDKRVRFEDPPTLAVEVEEKHVEVHRRPPPLREPVPRHITAVAPPCPMGRASPIVPSDPCRLRIDDPTGPAPTPHWHVSCQAARIHPSIRDRTRAHR